MTESSTARSESRATRNRGGGGNPVSRLFAAIAVFVRQILDELRKVVRPTGSELLNYTIVVIFFVLTIMAIVAGLDAVLQRLVLLVFAGS
ncbi:MAG: preprotein translocase subunit SecE [Candidatus Phosphoribacter sp.]|nr:preprotein translocase subunit SecE [Actinomycetales bacterium]